MCVKAHGSTPRSASPVIQFALAKTVPRNWAGRRAQEPRGSASLPPLHPLHTIPPPVAPLGTDDPRAGCARGACSSAPWGVSAAWAQPHHTRSKVSRASLTSSRRSADHPGAGRLRLGIRGHPSTSPRPSRPHDATPPVARPVVGRVSHVDLDGEGASLRASICLLSSKRGCALFLSVSHLSKD